MENQDSIQVTIIMEFLACHELNKLVVCISFHKKPKEEPNIVSASTNGTSIPEHKAISENRGAVETQDKVVILEGLGIVSAHEEWTPLSVSGQRPKPRYEHGATVLQDKMYVFGGNHNGRYLSDLQRDREDMVEFVRNTSTEFKEYYIQMQAAKWNQAPLPSEIYAWIGCNTAKFGHLYAAATTRPGNGVSVTSVLGGTSDNTGSSMARRLVLKTGLNMVLACNIPKDSPMLEAAAERKLVEKLRSLGYIRSKAGDANTSTAH